MTDLRTTLQTTLGNDYTLERELGGGGMSRVFLAHDTALGRRVVVKVLPGELAGGVNIERFRREIQLAAQLQHPHIVGVLTTGKTADGLPYFTMPFVEGESLRSRLARAGELPVPEAMRVLREVAKALAYAHRHGVVHRDIKPENVLLADETALVTDFGVAKALSAATAAPAPGVNAPSGSLTSLGVALGTPAYMAPEQAAADPSMDHRADIYAFGVLGYEMLTGRTPFGGRPPQQILAAHIAETPEPVTKRRPSTPPALAGLIMRCLEKHPADRPQGAGELLHELEMIATPSGGMDPTPAAPLRHREPADRVRLSRVLGVYAAAFVLVTVLAAVAIRIVGLPDWVLPGAVVVMALGLPVIVMTALVERVPEPREVSGPPGAALRSGTGRVLARVRPLFTWRRTVIGGVAAMGVFVVLIAGYMGSRTLGIGPAASLRSAGVLADRERLLIADFRGPAQDTSLGAVVTEAFRTDLGQSRHLSVVPVAAVRDVLRRMQRPAAGRIDLPVAREIATREGIKAILDGDIAIVGRQYILSARLVAAQDGDVMAAFRETASGPDDIIPAIDRLSKKLRARTGESLRRIQAADPLNRVTTASLDALRSYAQGVYALDVDDDVQKGLSLLQQSVTIDTGFAMAYRKIGIALSNRGLDITRQQEMLQKAFDRRDRLSDAERYLAVGSYYGSGPVFEPERAIAAYEALLDMQPDHTAALNNAALLYWYVRDYARAQRYLERAIRVDSSSSLYYTNLSTSHVIAGRFDLARAILDLYARRAPQSAVIPIWRANVEISAMNPLGALPHLQHARQIRRGDLGVRAQVGNVLSNIETIRGRLRDAERARRDVVSARRDLLADSQSALPAEVRNLFFRVWYGADTAAVARELRQVLARMPLASMPPLERPYYDLAELYILLGDRDRARETLAEIDARGNTAAAVGLRIRGGHRAIRARLSGQLALAEGRPADALDQFRRSDIGACEICPLPLIAQAWDQLGQRDSTIVTLERYLRPSAWRGFVDPQFLAPSLKRLGELYEARGDTAKAVSTYGRFAELWKDADPELQPQVREARRRIAVLSRRSG